MNGSSETRCLEFRDHKLSTVCICVIQVARTTRRIKISVCLDYGGALISFSAFNGIDFAYNVLQVVGANIYLLDNSEHLAPDVRVSRAEVLNKRPMGIEVAHVLMYPRTGGGAKLSLFSLYRQRFLRYRPIFKLAIFGHEAWTLAKVSKVAHILSVYPIGAFEIELIMALRAAVSETQADFQNCHISP